MRFYGRLYFIYGTRFFGAKCGYVHKQLKSIPLLLNRYEINLVSYITLHFSSIAERTAVDQYKLFLVSPD